MKNFYDNISITDKYFDGSMTENLVDEVNDFTLVQYKYNADSFQYRVFDDFDMLVSMWESKEDCLLMPLSDYLKSNSKKLFKEVIKKETEKNYKKLAKEHGFDFTPRKKSTGFLDILNKSDTLVIHCKDNSTEMLGQLYEGRNWDVLRDGNIDKDELHELLQSHDRIVCLGHGSGNGLFNNQGYGNVIGKEEAKYLRDKHLFIIWCHAETYAVANNLHGFITGNMPSDAGEAYMAGFKVGREYMDDNITYWSKCCANHIEQALKGDYEGAARNIRKEYLAVYGDKSKWDEQELGITQYNADRTTAI